MRNERKTFMNKSILISICLLFCNDIFGQDDYLKPDPFSLNLITGYHSFAKYDDINTKLIANGFEKIKPHNFVFGFEFQGMGKRSTLKSRFCFTNINQSKPKSTTALQTTTIELLYGYDLPPNSKNFYLFPLGGISMFDVDLLSKRNDGTKIDAQKTNFELTFGASGKLLLGKSFPGILNNVGLDFTFSIPFTQTNWKKDGKEFVMDTYTTKPNFSLTLNFGRAFYPASVR